MSFFAKTVRTDFNRRKPYITTQIFPAGYSTIQGRSLGSSLSFGIAADGTLPISYQWYKNGQVISGATSKNVTITSSLQSTDFGNYSCEATNAFGTAFCTEITIIQGILPGITFTSPSQTNIGLNQQTTLTVTATGSPTLLYAWRKGGVTLTSPLPLNNTLVVVMSSSQQAGAYDCVISNGAGSVISSTMSVSLTS